MPSLPRISSGLVGSCRTWSEAKISSTASRFPWLKTSSKERRTVALFSFAETLISSPLLLRTWRPNSFTRCHCVTTTAALRAIVANVMKRLMRGYLLYLLLETLHTHTSHKHAEVL